MNATTEVTLRLSRNDVGQILDGLEARLESWRQTVRWLDDGHVEGAVVDHVGGVLVIELECSDLEEAQRMVKCYEQLIETIREQL